ncbi:MAG: hypothetical protein KF857_02930 [Fimbriimonadaceae bacterium]|nr:hypothetical protein [Fimbriimonadaceae bacterium]
MKVFKTHAWLFCAGAMLLGSVARASLIDASILIEKAANNKSITVKYEGAAAASVEMRVNGVSILAKNLDDAATAGETEFAVDTAYLKDGDNLVEIFLFDKEGKKLGSEKTQIKVDRTGMGPAYIAKPLNSSTVMGNVDIQLGFKSSLSNVYVSFFINDEFKALKNYPPYNYLWDTTRVPNGWHEVQALVVDETNATFRTEKFRLFVNNPGGMTKRFGASAVAPAKPSEAPKTTPAVAPTAPKTTPTVAPNSVKPSVTEPAGFKPAEGASKASATAPANTVKPEINATPTGPAVTKPEKPATIEIDGSKPATTKPEVTKPVSTKPVETTKPTEATQPAVKPTKPAKDLVAVNFGVRVPNMGAYAVYFEGKKVKFDVQPQAKDGVPLTPFRHLMEHQGAVVDWHKKDQTVTSTMPGQTIWFQIGNDTAKVNGQDFRLEMAPFITHGRSIVPLSFISEALNVDVDYDPATGHVLIRKRTLIAKKN